MAASLPGAELFSKIRLFEEATCPGQLRCLGQNLFSKLGFFFDQTTCPGQLRCLGQNFVSKIGLYFGQATCPGQLRCLGQNLFSKVGLFLNKPLVPGSFAAWGSFFPPPKRGLSGILGLLCAEQDVRNLKKCTFKNYGTPARRTQRRMSQQMTFREFWDSGSQNKTSEISKT